MKEIIKEILETAIYAPSGENNQPWKFKLKDNMIDVFNVPERDTSLYNFRQQGLFVAHGALLENIIIASSALGYKADINAFPDKENSNHVASITLNKTEIRDEPLYPFIRKRATNRKPYYPDPLTNKEKAVLLELNRLGYGRVALLEDQKTVKELADVLCINERLVFENHHLHKFFFEHMRWTEKEAMDKRDGMYLKTMELPSPATLMFKLLFKRWRFVKFMGVSKFIAKQTKKMYLAAPAIGIITIDSDSSEDFLAGGRLMQRVWLEATRMGLSLHPSAGTIFFIQRVLKGATEGFIQENVEMIKSVHQKLVSAFQLHDETIAFLFRIGRSDPPSACSPRLSLDQLIIKNNNHTKAQRIRFET
jgi:hypothetical protein